MSRKNKQTNKQIQQKYTIYPSGTLITETIDPDTAIQADSIKENVLLAAKNWGGYVIIKQGTEAKPIVPDIAVKEIYKNSTAIPTYWYSEDKGKKELPPAIVAIILLIILFFMYMEYTKVKYMYKKSIN